MAEPTTGEECSIDDFIKARLKSCQVTEKGMITGYLGSREAYDELFRDLKVLGCRYSVRSGYAGKTDSGNLQYKTISPDLQIPFTGSPFHVEGTTYFLCTHGFRYYKSKAGQESNEADGNDGVKKKRRKTNDSIKMGCPAKMTVKCIRVYPDYKTSSDSWRRKCDVLKRLKEDMKLVPPPRHELNFWIAVSPESAHTHERTTTQRIQPLHPDLISEIHKLVTEGVTSIPVIKSRLSVFVENMFKKSSIRPDKFNTAFYPCDKSIYNHVYDAKSSISKYQEDDTTEAQQVCSSTSTNKPVDVAPTTNQSHEISEKCDSGLAVVPVIDSTFTSEWSEQLPSNFVQVVNNNGTLMLMVAQPLGNQIANRVENSVSENPPNLVNVNLDDNIYTVITNQSDQRILHLNGNSGIIMSSDDQIGEILTVEDSNQVLSSVKNEGLNVDIIMNVQTAPGVEDEKDDNSCNEDPSHYLFVGVDPQNEILEEVNSQAKEFTTLSALPHTQPLRVQGDSSYPSSFKEDLSKRRQGDALGQKDGKDAIKLLGTKNRLKKSSNIDIESNHLEEKSITSRKALRDSAQDIINMSYWSTNNTLLQEMVRVFDKYRKRMREELESKGKKAGTNTSVLETTPETFRGNPISKTLIRADANQRHLKHCRSSVVKKKVKRSGRTIYSSESSIDDYDDLVIND